MLTLETSEHTNTLIIEDIMMAVNEELNRATNRFGPFNSAHEGYAILKEEVDELWDDVKNNASKYKMCDEAVQVAAMAIRFIYDICPENE